MFASNLSVPLTSVQLFLAPHCLTIISQDFTLPSLKFETVSGYARQTDVQPEEQKQDLEGYQIDVSRAWDTR